MLQQLFADEYNSVSSGFSGGFLSNSSFWHGLLVASALGGTIVGALIFAKPSDKYGRRSVLMLLGVLYLISAIGSALAWGMWSFVCFRVIGGLAVGGASVVSPMYVAEISPARYRGSLVAMVQLNIVLGILLAYLSNFLIAGMELDAAEWRWMFGVEAVPALAFTLLLFTNPRSPRWLVANGKSDEAATVLAAVGNARNIISKEIEAIHLSLTAAKKSLGERFFQRKYSKPILLAIAIAAFNQLSGINALIYYTRRIFEMAGAEGTSALLQSVIIGGTNLVMTFLALMVIDRLGRKKLMLIGSFGYIISLGATAIAFYNDSTGPIILISLIVFIASHAFGQGAVIWVFIGEIFPNALRARGQALGSFTHWIMAAVISLTFPMIAEVSGAHIFAFYGICMVLQLIWVLTVMPETKRISLEEIEKTLGIS